MANNKYLLGLGSLYVDTNYFGVETQNQNSLVTGGEYVADKYEVRSGGSVVNFILQSNLLRKNIGLIGKTGLDENSNTLLKLLSEQNIDTSLIKREEGLQTNVDTGLILANGENVQISAGNANQSLSLADIDLENTIFSNTEAIYFGGSFKQKLLWPEYPKLFGKLKNKNIKLFMDPGKVHVGVDKKWLDIFKDTCPFLDIYFANDTEIKSVTEVEDVKDAILKVLSWGTKMVVIKCGSLGGIVADNNSFYEFEGHKIKVVNTVGAGDSFNAGFVCEYLNGNNINICADFANAVGALYVSTGKNQTRDDVDKFINKS